MRVADVRRIHCRSGWRAGSVVIALALLGCDQMPGEAPPGDDPGALPENALQEHRGEGSGGDGPSFSWLPPISWRPQLVGSFDDEERPVVKVDEIDGAGKTVRTMATFTRDAAKERDRLHVTRWHFVAHWRTGDSRLNLDRLYRARVLLGGVEIGAADLQPVRGKKRGHEGSDDGREGEDRSAGPTRFVAGSTVALPFFLNRCAAVDCKAGDACNSKGKCNAKTGQCEGQKPLPDGTTCSDGNACTQTDSCRAGVCVGANPVVCPSACGVVNSCVPATGMCSAPPPSGPTCGDGVVSGNTPQAIRVSYVGLSCDEFGFLDLRLNGATILFDDLFTPSCSCMPGVVTRTITDPSALALLRSGSNTFSFDFFQYLGWLTVEVVGSQSTQEVVVYDAFGGTDAQARNPNICAAGSNEPPAGTSASAVLDLGEGCDDGNCVSGDGCSATCQPE